jgi:hypothetical protein
MAWHNKKPKKRYKYRICFEVLVWIPCGQYRSLMALAGKNGPTGQWQVASQGLRACLEFRSSSRERGFLVPGKARKPEFSSAK